MSIIRHLGEARKRMKREQRMLFEAGIDKETAMYPLLLAILGMPRQLHRLIVVAVMAPILSVGALGVGLCVVWWPSGVVVRQTDLGTQLLITAPKGVEATWCMDGKTLCVTQKR